MMNNNIKLEIERRFIIKSLTSNYLSISHKTEFIHQVFYKDGTGRLRYCDGRWFFTEKRGDGISRTENEREICLGEYLHLFYKHIDMSITPIVKLRYHLGRFEIDAFLSHPFGCYMIMECELNNINEELPPIPGWIKVIMEITGRKEFNNSSIYFSGKFPDSSAISTELFNAEHNSLA